MRDMLRERVAARRFEPTVGVGVAWLEVGVERGWGWSGVMFLLGAAPAPATR